MRWYDIEPDVYMAISMIECADKNAQVDCANYIIKEITQKDKEYNYIKNMAKANMASKYTRWYDNNETISKAFAYLKGTSKQIQKEVALSVLDYMRTAA